MEIEQNIKEFTDQGEVVLLYTISSEGRVLQVTNADAAVVSYSVSEHEMISGVDKFLNSRIDSRAKIWSARVEDNNIIFSNVEGEVPSQISYSLCEGGFEITKFDGLGSVSTLHPFYIATDQNPELTIEGRYAKKPVDQLDRSSEIEVEGWNADYVFNVAHLEDNLKKVSLRSSMPLLKISKQQSALSLLALDDTSKYESDSCEQENNGAKQVIDHTIIYSFELK